MCPGLESVVSDVNQANFQPAFDRCLHSVMASVVSSEKTGSGPSPRTCECDLTGNRAFTDVVIELGEVTLD